jgi:hypothetical protein
MNYPVESSKALFDRTLEVTEGNATFWVYNHADDSPVYMSRVGRVMDVALNEATQGGV